MIVFGDPLWECGLNELASASRELIKLDAGGHDCDHTIAGLQPATWDLAGAIVEWRFDQRHTEVILAGATTAASPPRA